jgi:hypothetical protein
MPWALAFFTYSSIKEHFTSIIGLKGNKSYNCQSLQLRNNGFWVWGGLATANPSKISIPQFWTMSTFHMARALLTETMFIIKVCIHCLWGKKLSSPVESWIELSRSRIRFMCILHSFYMGWKHKSPLHRLHALFTKLPRCTVTWSGTEI